MKIRVLGCHGSDQLLEGDSTTRQCRTCGFLINDTVMVDAGTIGAALTLAEQKRIRHVLLSHIHFDHIQGLPTLADNLVDDPEGSVVITSIPEVMNDLRSHIFNGVVYPDFMELPSVETPVFVARSVEAGLESMLSGLHVRPIRVNHLVPTVGFMIREGNCSILYSGDTYQTDEIWKVAAQEPTLRAAFIETSFPDEMASLAYASKHLTPSLFAQEFRKIGRPDLPVFIYHVKPRVLAKVQHQLDQLNIKNLTVLEEGQEIIL